MKNIIYISLTSFFLISCKAQQITTNYNKDFILINIEDSSIESSIPNKITNKKIVLFFDKQIIPKAKEILLYKKNTKDTMKIHCYCNYNENLYLKNLKFSKGNYTLNVIEELKKKDKIITINDIEYKIINTKPTEIKTSANKVLPKAGLKEFY